MRRWRWEGRRKFDRGGVNRLYSTRGGEKGFKACDHWALYGATPEAFLSIGFKKSGGGNADTHGEPR